MKVHDSQGGMEGFGADGPAVPLRGPHHAKHRGRKGRKHGKGGKRKARRK